MPNNSGILVLEGADASGKTTLARHLVKHHSARYLHLGPYKDVWRWHLGAYLRAQRLAAAGHLVVVDRHWPSECVCGAIYRGGSAYPIAARCFDRLWLRSAAIYILCVPSNSRRQEQDHHQRDLSRKGNTYSQDRTRPVRQVIARYRQLMTRQPASFEMKDYLFQAAWRTRPDVVYYDRFTEGHDLRALTYRLLTRLSGWRTMQRSLGLDPASPNYAGHPVSARWLLVGEAGSPRVFRPDINFPFVDRCTHLSSATWLNRALHQLSVPEPHLLWCNTAGPELAQLARDPVVRSLPAIALGRVAERALYQLSWPDVRSVVHPQYARRFQHSGSYAEKLRETLT